MCRFCISFTCVLERIESKLFSFPSSLIIFLTLLSLTIFLTFLSLTIFLTLFLSIYYLSYPSSLLLSFLPFLSLTIFLTLPLSYYLSYLPLSYYLSYPHLSYYPYCFKAKKFYDDKIFLDFTFLNL